MNDAPCNPSILVSWTTLPSPVTMVESPLKISNSQLSEKPRKLAYLRLELHGSLEMGKEVGNIQPMRDLSLMITLYHLLPGEGNGNPLQYSCLENSMDRGAWWATIHGVAKSRTRLSDFCVCVCVRVCITSLTFEKTIIRNIQRVSIRLSYTCPQLKTINTQFSH